MNQMVKEQLEMLIRQFKELTGVCRGAVSHTGVSQNEFWIWYTLTVSDDEYSQQDICNMWSLAKQTVNNIITHMVQKGYAFLEVVPDTRNRKIIRLTETGRLYGTSLVTPVYSAEERALNRLNPEELVACTKTISKFIGILKEELDEPYM
ncbi:MAG: MarR family transcriptional regulator [Eubacteriales bacterium]|nr:MarR family transcriptional regulator [Eubacteriales bacterium]